MSDGDDQPSFSVSLDHAGACLVLRGEFDLSCRDVLVRALEELAAVVVDRRGGAVPRVLVDLREVHFLDSSALGELVVAARAHAPARLTLLVTPGTERLLTVTSLTDVFTVLTWNPPSTDPCPDRPGPT